MFIGMEIVVMHNIVIVVEAGWLHYLQCSGTQKGIKTVAERRPVCYLSDGKIQTSKIQIKIPEE